MDIKKSGVIDTTVIHLKDANGELLYEGAPAAAKKITVTVYGPGTKVYAKAQAAQNRRLLARAQVKGKGLSITEDRAEFLADITADSAYLEYGDSALTGRDLYKAVYSDTSIGFIAEQVSGEAGDWANFTNGSPTA